MTTVYRATTNRAEDGYPGSTKLTLEILEGIDFKKVIYGERSQSGAMGNAGGIILYVIKDNKLTRYETNVSKDSKTTIEALKQITLNEELFDLFYGGMGNGVFIRKDIDLEIDAKNKCFWLKQNDQKYKIESSVPGVFRSVVARIENGTKGYDAMHEAWEQSLRDRFATKGAKKNNLIDDALQIGKEEGFIKIGRLQRRLRLGYQDAKQLVDTMEAKGLIESYDETRWKIVKNKENSKHE